MWHDFHLCHTIRTMTRKMVPVKISKQGRLVVPVELRRELGIVGEDDLVASVEEGKLVLKRRQAILEELWAMFADVEGSLADELIAERREEARKESEETEEWLKRAPRGS